MTWEELCEKACEMGYIHCFDDHYEMCEILDKNGFCFYENGKIKTDTSNVISENKSIEQMYQLMKALQ